MTSEKDPEGNARQTNGAPEPPAAQKPVKEAPPAEADAPVTAGPAAEAPAPDWVAELDSYPLRDKSEDPRWAVRTVWIWVGIALASLVFILVLLVLGAIYD